MEFINNENSSDLTVVLNNKLWFRGKNQKQRAISERQKLYGNKGIVISKNESKSNKQMSSVFENPYELYDYTKQTPPHLRCFYEIVEHNSKLYFDIEYDNYCLVLTEVLQHLYSILKLLYNISPKKRIILSAHRYNKKSWHIIFPEYSISPEERKKLSKYLQTSAKAYVDWRVYNTNQPFRLCGSYKSIDFSSKLYLMDDNENKILNYDSNTFINTMVTQINPDAICIKSKI
mgnify:CR=1 FL=1|tara:strand:+ start:60 stop:755 length:696 start_codon:yes stop_codon:yes gene_type:complete